MELKYTPTEFTNFFQGANEIEFLTLMGYKDQEIHLITKSDALLFDMNLPEIIMPIIKGKNKDKLKVVAKQWQVFPIKIDKLSLRLYFPQGFTLNNEFINELKNDLILSYPDKLYTGSLKLIYKGEPIDVKITASQLFELSKLFSEYNDWYKKHLDYLTPQFKVILAEIGNWIKKKYQITPQLKNFVEWFIRTEIGSWESNIGFSIDEKTGKINKAWLKDFDFSVLKKQYPLRLSREKIKEYTEYVTNELNSSNTKEDSGHFYSNKLNRKSLFLVKKVKVLTHCSSKIFQIEGSKYEPPFETIPTKGKHDFNTCNKCKDTSDLLLQQLNERFKKFPNCCQYHSKLKKESWFDIQSFNNSPEIVTDKILYTNQHIINSIDRVNWLKDITDYIDYTVESFGSMPVGYGEPLFLSHYFEAINELLELNTEIFGTKKEALKQYIDSFNNSKNSDKDNLENLLSTYQKWLNAFPFNISFFKELKSHFETNIPIVEGEWLYNPYLGIHKGKILSSKKLINYLVEQTEQLILQINIPELITKGIVNDLNRQIIEFESESLRVDTINYFNKYSTNELQYVNALEKWLKRHIEYFERIEPRFKSISPINTPTEFSKSNKGIVFNKQNTIEALHSELKGYFPEQENNLKQVLEGEIVNTTLLFPHNQNKFVEVFRRLKYNNYTPNSPTEIKEWLCKNFKFKYKKGTVEEIRNFNNSSVWDLLTKAKGEPPKKERICQVDWLPYKSPGQLQNEIQKEKS